MERIKPDQRDRWSTNEAHLPEGRREWRHQNTDYWQKMADDMGEEVGAYIREVFSSDKQHSQLRKVQRMLGLLDSLPNERASSVCSRASFFGNTSFAGLNRIVRKGLDFDDLPSTTPINPVWSTRYARAADEFLINLEATNESH